MHLTLISMSQSKFDKAVSIVQSLPKDGPIKPSQDDQLYVRRPCIRIWAQLTLVYGQFYARYKQGMLS